MIATRYRRLELPKIPPKKIPASLIYEIIDGKAVYYKNYRQVLTNTKKIEEIMGASTLQNVIIEYILRILFRNLDEKKYRILTNEQGLHVDKKNNFSGDITIFEDEKLSVKTANKNYASVAPKIQIEVDVSVDTELFETPDNYIYTKTDKLLDFGVEKVIWILSDSKKILMATKTNHWEVLSWHNDIDVLENIKINVGQYLQKAGSPFA